MEQIIGERSPNTSPFGRLEPWILAESVNLTKNELRVLLALVYRAGSSGSAWPSQAQIAEDIGEPPGETGIRKVRAAIAGLESREILSVSRSRGGNRYAIETGRKPTSRTGEKPTSPTGRKPTAGRKPTGPTGRKPPSEPVGNLPPEQIKEQNKEQIKGCSAPELPGIEPAIGPKGPGEIERAFQAWAEATGKTRARLDTERKRWIERGIREYGVETAIEILRGIARDDFAMGRAAPERYRGTPRAYNEPRHAFRSADRAEHFLSLERASESSTGRERAIDASDLRGRFMDSYLAAISEIENASVRREPFGGSIRPEPAGFREAGGERVPWWGIADLDHYAANLAAVRRAGKALEGLSGAEFLLRPELESAKVDLAEALNRARKEAAR
jgi:hypothetical protein